MPLQYVEKICAWWYGMARAEKKTASDDIHPPHLHRKFADALKDEPVAGAS
jgi:hypothetical protein